MRRLRESLGLREASDYCRSVAACGEFTEREPNWSWSVKMLSWAVNTDATHFLTLQDDALVSPLFWPTLAAMVEAVPDRLIGLEAAHPVGPLLARAGHRWMSTSDFLVGVAWVAPMSVIREFRAWCESALRPGAIQAISEDSLLGLWAAVTGHRVLHPIPTPTGHDTSLASTYANDGHSHRRPTVTWRDGEIYGWQDVDLTRPAFWRQRELPPHLGRFYTSTPLTMARWVNGWSDEDIRRVEDDVVTVRRTRGGT